MILGNNVIIGDNVKMGKNVRIGSNTKIGNNVIIGDNVEIGNNVLIGDYVNIGDNVKIGDNSRIIYRAQIYSYSEIGSHSIIGGFIAEHSKIGNYCRIFGKLLHSHIDPTLDWDQTTEDSPVIKDYVFVGFDALIIGGITIEERSYITAGAIVTKNVPQCSIVYGINNIVPYYKWKGRLKHSRFWKKCRGELE